MRNSGSIPACAGEPAALDNADGLGEVYPRVRGGTINDPRRHRVNYGLSPRARGNPLRSYVNIPIAKVYPRVRGGTLHH